MIVTKKPMKLRDLFKNYNKEPGKPNKLDFNFPIQRPEQQWDNERLGRLVHAILLGDPIPPLYITHNRLDNTVTQLTLDGKQRLTKLFSYCTTNVRLWKGTPCIEVTVYDKDGDGNSIFDDFGNALSHKEEVVLAGKTFKQQPESIQEQILDFTFECFMISEYTQDDLSRIMFNLNNGVSASNVQKSIMKLGMHLGGKIKSLTNHSLFEERITPYLTSAQRKNSEEMKCVLTSLMQWTGSTSDEFSYSKLNNIKDLNKFVMHFKNAWSENEIQGISDILDTLYNVLPDGAELDSEIGKKYLNANSLPVLVMNVDKYHSMKEDGLITEESYKEFLYYWFTEGVNKASYKYFSVLFGKSIGERNNVEGRIEIMDTELEHFVGLISDEEMKEFDENFIPLIKEKMSEREDDMIDKVSDFEKQFEGIENIADAALDVTGATGAVVKQDYNSSDTESVSENNMDNSMGAKPARNYINIDIGATANKPRSADKKQEVYTTVFATIPDKDYTDIENRKYSFPMSNTLQYNSKRE